MTDYIPVIPDYPFVVPAKAGIQRGRSAAFALGPRFREGDGVFRMNEGRVT